MFPSDTGMTLRLSRVIVAVVAGAAFHEAVAKEAADGPYLQSGPDGAFYARCIPAATGGRGTTEIYRVKDGGDERVDRYEWYCKHGVVLGWSPIVGKVAVMAIHPQFSNSEDKQVELGFWLGGKLLKTWTIDELKRLGAEEAFGKPGGRMAAFQVLGCQQIPGSNEYVFVIQVSKEKKLSFDILTGDIHSIESPDNPSISLRDANANVKPNPLQTTSSLPYEVVLDAEGVVFEKVEVANINLTVRDLGVRKMIAPDLFWGLTMVWDGKAYQRDPKYVGNWNGPWEILPRTAWKAVCSPTEYLLPKEVLSPGRHTIALRDAFAESNTLTIFIEPKK